MAREMEKKIDSDLKEAMKARDKVRLSTLRMIKAALKNVQLEKRETELDDDEVIGVISGQAKRRSESILAFEKGDRPDLAEKEKAELEIIRGYLPEQLGEEELLKMISEAIAEAGASTKSDVGKVMKLVMPRVRGRADGKQVNQLVAARLSPAAEAGGEKTG